MNTPLDDASLERQARRNVRARMGWLAHAGVFLAVNAVLWTVHTLHGGRPWVIAPTLGWGLALAIHGAAVLLRTQGAGLRETLVARERARLAALQKDPW